MANKPNNPVTITGKVRLSRSVPETVRKGWLSSIPTSRFDVIPTDTNGEAGRSDPLNLCTNCVLSMDWIGNTTMLGISASTRHIVKD